MAHAELLRKLQIAKGSRIWVENAPAGFLSDCETIFVGPGGKPDAAVSFVETPGEVARLAPTVVEGNGSPELVWFAYRKGAAGKARGLTRDVGWDSLAQFDWRPVRSIAIDEDWTGLRFRPVDKVTSAKPDAWRTRGQG